MDQNGNTIDNTHIGDVLITEDLEVGGNVEVDGDLTVVGSITSGSKSADKFLAGDGSAGSPSYTFTADTNTGLYRGADDTIHFVTAGLDIMDITINGLLPGFTNAYRLGDNTNYWSQLSADDIYGGAGTEASPTYSFITDTNTGMYRDSANKIGFSVGGTGYLTINNARFAPLDDAVYDLGGSSLTFAETYSQQFRGARGTLANPSFNFGSVNGDDNTGMWSPSEDLLAFGCAGVETLRMSADAQCQFADGTVSRPSMSFASDIDTGFYKHSATGIGFCSGGVLEFNMNNARIVPELDNDYELGSSLKKFKEVNSYLFLADDGSESSPSIGFDDDQNTGIFRQFTDTVSVTSGNFTTADLGKSVQDYYSNLSLSTTDMRRYYSNVTGTEVLQFYIEADGDTFNTNNSYGGISDEKLKQQITDSKSQWDDIKSLKFKKYKLNRYVEAMGDDAPEHIGVLAQDLQKSGMGGLVSKHKHITKKAKYRKEKDKETGEVKDIIEEPEESEEQLSVKYSVLYIKGLQALQEALKRIEILEETVEGLKKGDK